MNAATGKGPHSLRTDGSLKASEDHTREATPASVSNVANFLLPTPFTGVALRQLWTTVLTDYAFICASWAAAAGAECLVRGESWVLPGFVVRIALLRALAGGLLFAELSTLVGYSEGLYEPRRECCLQAAILAKALGWTTILLGSGIYLSGTPIPSFACLACSALLSFASLLTWRHWRARAKLTDAAVANHTHNVLIVGAGPTGRQVAAYLERHPESGRVVRGFLDDGNALAFGVLGPPEKLASIARAEFVDEVILAAPGRSDLAQSIIYEARRNHLDVRAVPDLYGCESSRPWIEPLGTVSLVTLHEEKLPDAGLFLKRVLDVVLSATALLLTAPVTLLIALVIKLDSVGPVLYSAPRVGRRGKRFRCHKFRTMSANAGQVKDDLRAQNQREGPCFKIAQDPRITRAGRWLRRYSLDELPQLWNVFRGEMSLVGPRPHPLDDFARYELKHFRRLDVTPGITGLWQVTARRSPSFDTNMALDLEYIERWSVWLDLRILLKTVSVVFQGTGV